jgi:nucleotide-binding universal stress UspA family protein
MFTRILVPLDGSELAERAVPVAARIARASGGSVLLLQVLALPITPLYGPIYVPYEGNIPADLERDRAEAQAYLHQVAASPALAGLSVQTYTMSGVPAASILDSLDQCQADLIVLSSHGRTGITRWVLGSVAQHVARHSPVPVMVLRATGKDFPTTLDRPARVLVPLDGSALAEAALDPAADMAIAASTGAPAELHLLLVVDRYLAAIQAAPDALLIGGAESYLTRVAERLTKQRPATLKVSWSVEASMDIAGSILAVAQPGAEKTQTTTEAGADPSAGHFDFLTMATNGRTGFKRWALGSVTERVLSATKLPLLIVRPTQATEEVSPLATSGD